MIQFEHVCKSYGKTPILKDLNFTIEDGQFVVLIGPSGCGKTTTLKTINRLIDIDSGTISIDGKNIQSQDKVELRRHIGYVIQQIGLFPNMTVAQNICVVPKLLKYDKAKCDEIVREMLQLVGMEQYADKYPSELSGGQQQRIGVLRALAASPPIVLMDEPFSALDPMTRETLQDEVKNIQQKLRKTVIFVSHDMGEALKLADVIIFMSGGEIVQMASPEEMLEHPANDLVRNFLGKHAPDTPAPSTVEGAGASGACLPRKFRTRSLAGCSSISSGEAIWTISPPDMKMMTSASFRASPMSWLTNTMVLFSFCWMFFTSSWSVSRVMGSRALKGSSISTMGGDAASARRTPMRCCGPLDSSEGYLSA